MTSPTDASPLDAYLKVHQSIPGSDGPAYLVFKKQADGSHAPAFAIADAQFAALLAALGAVPSTGLESGTGTAALSPADLATLANATNQLTLIDRLVREGARTQNVLSQTSDNAASTRVLSYSTMTQYTATDAQSGVAVGDIVLCISDFSVSSEPATPDEYWTTPGMQKWIKVFDAISAQTVQLSVPPIDTNFATQDDSGVVTRTVFSRTLTRRVIDSSLVESLQTATETRTVQASHIYPYPSIFDSGWV